MIRFTLSGECFIKTHTAFGSAVFVITMLFCFVSVVNVDAMSSAVVHEVNMVLPC